MRKFSPPFFSKLDRWKDSKVVVKRMRNVTSRGLSKGIGGQVGLEFGKRCSIRGLGLKSMSIVPEAAEYFG